MIGKSKILYILIREPVSYTHLDVYKRQVFKGIRFEEGSAATFKNTTLEYGGGIQVLTTTFLMDNCTVRNFKSGLVTGAAINFSRGNPVVKNSTFLNNDLPAVASGANQSVALEFTNNNLSGNTKLNSNRPQINMGPSGTGTTKILNNTVLGDRTLTKVGGISVSSLLGVENHVLIDGNTAVSYTHLDVYKRQVFDFRQHYIFRKEW